MSRLACYELSPARPRRRCAPTVNRPKACPVLRLVLETANASPCPGPRVGKFRFAVTGVLLRSQRSGGTLE